jgi:hypothetical protein
MVFNTKPVEAPKSTTAKAPKVVVTPPVIPTQTAVKVSTSGVEAPGQAYITQGATYAYDRILAQIGVNQRWRRIGKSAADQINDQSHELIDVSVESDNIQSNFDVIQEQFAVVSNFMIGLDSKFTLFEGNIKKGLADILSEGVKSQSKIVSQVNTQLETFDDNMEALQKRIDDQDRQIDEMFAKSKRNDDLAEQLKKNQEQLALSKDVSQKSEPAKVVKKDDAGSITKSVIENLFEDYLLYKGATKLAPMILSTVTRAFPWVVGLVSLYELYKGGAFDPLFNVWGDAKRAGKPHSWWEKFTGSETRDNMAGMREAEANKNKPEKDEDLQLPLRYIAGDIIKVQAANRLLLKAKVLRIEADRIEWAVKEGSGIGGGSGKATADPKDSIVGGMSETATGNNQSVLGYLGSKVGSFFAGGQQQTTSTPGLFGLGQRMGQMEGFHNAVPLGAESLRGRFGPGFSEFGNGLLGGGHPGARGGGGGGAGGGDYTPAPTKVDPKRNALQDTLEPRPSGGPGSSRFLAEQRSHFFDELDKNPKLRDEVMRSIRSENGKSSQSMSEVLESMVNRADMHGYKSLEQQLHDGFYGPINRGDRAFTRPLSEKERAMGEDAIAKVRGGSNAIDFRTDQGMLTDPGSREYMAEPDHGGHIVASGENYFFMGKKGRDWAARMRAGDAEFERTHPVQKEGEFTSLQAMNKIEGPKGKIAKILAGSKKSAQAIADAETAKLVHGIPNRIVETARQIATAKGPGAVEQFMAQQGYPKSGAWCGKFAASVITAAGGTPPKNPQLASNWRNYGVLDPNGPHPGDIAVRKPQFHSSLGDGRTGNAGSHVTIVNTFDPKNPNRFGSIGGNQGALVTSMPTNQYDFYSPSLPPKEVTTPNATKVEVPTTPVAVEHPTSMTHEQFKDRVHTTRTDPNSSLFGLGKAIADTDFKSALKPVTPVTTNRAGNGAILDRMTHAQFKQRVAMAGDHEHHDPNAQKAMNGAILSRALPHKDMKERVHTAREGVANRQTNTNGAILDRKKPSGPQVKAADPNAQKNTNGAILDRKKPEPPQGKAETSSKPKDYTNQFSASPSSSNAGDSIPPSESDDGSGDYGNCLI